VTDSKEAKTVPKQNEAGSPGTFRILMSRLAIGVILTLEEGMK
jgi:hypothetical protein